MMLIICYNTLHPTSLALEKQISFSFLENQARCSLLQGQAQAIT